MAQNFFDEEELTKLRNTTEIYYHVKNLLFYSEQLNDQESFLPAINEIKDSFDHLMRVCAVKFELIEGDQQSIDTNLGKTYSHIYRALYDLLDYTVIFQRKLIYNKIKDISSDTLATIYPAYYQTILPEVENSFSKISKIKECKDIGNPNTKDIEEHIELIESVKVHILDIDRMLPSLLKYENEKKEKDKLKENEAAQIRKKEHIFTVIVGIICAIVGAVAGILYSK
jgi:hypothetical protein